MAQNHTKKKRNKFTKRRHKLRLFCARKSLQLLSSAPCIVLRQSPENRKKKKTNMQDMSHCVEPEKIVYLWNKKGHDEIANWHGPFHRKATEVHMTTSACREGESTGMEKKTQNKNYSLSTLGGRLWADYIWSKFPKLPKNNKIKHFVAERYETHGILRAFTRDLKNISIPDTSKIEDTYLENILSVAGIPQSGDFFIAGFHHTPFGTTVQKHLFLKPGTTFSVLTSAALQARKLSRFTRQPWMSTS